MHRSVTLGSVLALSTTAAFAQDQAYNYTDFDRIEVSAGVEVDVMVGSDFSVTGMAKRGNIENLEVTLEGDTLNITRDTSAGWTGWSLLGVLNPDDRFLVTVTMPVLTEVESTSGSEVMVVGPSETLEKLSSTSGSTLVVQDATLASIAVEATSGSAMSVSGTCTDIEAEASSGASLSADGLTCETADVHASSGASLSATATDKAEAEASSGASLRLTGGAEITKQSVSSGASIRAN